METVNDIKEALSARSRTATLDELKSEGRKRVRLIRAEHVAAMISEAVHAAIEHSGLVAPEQVESLIEKSRQEFRSILKEREAEAQRMHEVEQALAEREHELDAARHRHQELVSAMAALRHELDAAREQLEAAREAPAASPAPAAMPGSELILSLVQEMATLKANMMAQQAQPQQPQMVVPDFSAAIEKLTGSLNDRLETLGKKMGVSAAVDNSAPTDFGGLFRDADKALESNMDNIQVKQKAGGGIAANLARLKKLKGGD